MAGYFPVPRVAGVPGIVASLIRTTFRDRSLTETSMRQLIAGNWKMHGLGSALTEIQALCAALTAKALHADVLICPPVTLVARAVAAAAGAIAIGAQDCHVEASGPFTGDISAEMLKDAGATSVIVGHSERRQYHHENDEMVHAKARAAHRAGLVSIICVGETEDQRMHDQALNVIARQLAGSVPDDARASTTVIAYEPVWAIGTGRTPSNEEIAQMHGHIRGQLSARFDAGAAGMRILYGGSVKPSNAQEILNLPNVDGALVGGASLKAVDFLAIVGAAKAPS
jgi:triosephosphate isomerase